MSEPQDDWLVREQFRVVRVSSLPYAHNPFRCDHAARFEAAESDDDPGRRFFESLTEDERRTCHYHRLADWKLVATASVRFFRAFQDCALSELLAALDEPGNPHEQVSWLFHDPIIWKAGSPHVRNGQHRTCAIRASGARLCVIDHDRFTPYRADPEPPSQSFGAGARG